MKVLMINGSPRAEGNTYVALREMEKIFKEEGIETEILQVGNKAVRGCIACGSCAKNGKYLFSSSKVADSPPLLAATTLAPTFMVLSKPVL